MLLFNRCYRQTFKYQSRWPLQYIRTQNNSQARKCETLSIDDLPVVIKLPKKQTTSVKSGEELSTDSTTIEDRGAKKETRVSQSLFKTVRSLMDRYKDHVVFVQVGGFYELYFEHAQLYAPKIDIKLSQRRYKSEGSVPFAGFPVASLDKYLKILVNDLGYSVAVADQFANEDPNEGGRLTRRVARIVTPGTLIDEALRNFQRNNYLLAISFPEDPCKNAANPDMKIGLAWSDVALGDFYVQETTLENLITNIARIKPSEILLDDSLALNQLESGRWYPELSELKRFYLKYQKLPSNRKPIHLFYDMFHDDPATLNRCFDGLSVKEISASISALYYISESFPDSELNLALPQRQILSQSMQIDSRTSDALELHRTFRDDKKTGSLISSVQKTVTSSGARLLSSWISAPSTSASEIRRRQKLVDLLRRKSHLRASLIQILKASADISRIVQRLSLGKIDALELCSLAKTLYIVNDLKLLFEELASETKTANTVLSPVISNLVSPIPIADEINSIIDEEALIRNIRAKEIEKGSEEADEEEEQVEEKRDTFEIANDDHELNNEDWIVRKESSPLLRKLHDEYEGLLDKKDVLQQEFNNLFIESYGCRSVSLQLHKVYGFVVGVTGSQRSFNSFEDLPDEYNLVYKTKLSRFYHHREWKNIGTDTQSHIYRIRAEESKIISSLRRKILEKTSEIRDVAHTLDYIDVLSSFAVLALEKNLVMPKIATTTELSIRGGRHLVVEDGLKGSSKQFTTNDCDLNLSNGQESMWVVSGPNMGGKSTFLRQNALIVIMAQMGSFVPADEATIGIVDKLFSRVGSADDLYRELSTFMVEMVETSFILKNATPKSMAILDEVGRGTSGREGLAIAFATLLHILKRNNCRCLFATHFGQEIYQQLEEVDQIDHEIGFYKTSIEKVNGGDHLTENKFIFDHKLKRGISSKSYAIEVADLAGFPKEALAFARESLDRLNQEELTMNSKSL